MLFLISFFINRPVKALLVNWEPAFSTLHSLGVRLDFGPARPATFATFATFSDDAAQGSQYL
jgi:hypothetical protein